MDQTQYWTRSVQSMIRTICRRNGSVATDARKAAQLAVRSNSRRAGPKLSQVMICTSMELTRK